MSLGVRRVREAWRDQAPDRPGRLPRPARPLARGATGARGARASRTCPPEQIVSCWA
ncbi:hypothetical protein SAM23877_6024 [Streptomyces ambofaciens ATCC 23877]|uniref:Uncharacterized protein n=1 Tax=Streptomyces ambofaciens (strain ATCC 23877 / 3486 / DSM 40053 / JCM 4204 / NBRC 12836 / NRRL B-2516) TaxID=278992 RepID=A0A0K2B1C9_STRA7|nr:hypothetical protein SAM23877_6024 [Streptomyces ambofaciens ATCC 23877]